MTVNKMNQYTQGTNNPVHHVVLHGFPESHAAKLCADCLLERLSQKHHYLTALERTTRPMGFYSPATLIKDAQRHGQRFPLT